MTECSVCGCRSRLVVGNICDSCKRTGEILEPLSAVIDDKIRESPELNTEEEEFRWLASLGALYSDYRLLAHVYKFWRLVFEHIRRPSQSISSTKISDRIRSLRDIHAWKRFYENLGMIEDDGRRITIPDGSIAGKALVTVKTRGSEVQQRPTFCVIGYILLKIADAIFDGREDEIPNGNRKMRRFIASIPFFLTRFMEGEKVRRTDLRRFLAARGVGMADMIEKIEASLAGSDTVKRVDWFRERRWEGIYEAIYETNPYVTDLFERVRERERLREREIERGME